MTDPHVHFRDWNQSSKETVQHGITTAYEAGFNVFFDMPNCNPPLVDRKTIEQRLELGNSVVKAMANEGKFISYHVYAGLTNNPEQIKEAVNTYNDLFPAVCGLKLFASQSTGNMGIIGQDNQMSIYKTLANLGYEGVLAVHCEKEELFDNSASRHCEKRGPQSEVASVCDQIYCAQESGFKGTLHIAHVSTKGALEAIEAARQTGLKVTCGATPHHILLNRDSESTIVKMNPPLRTEEDRLAIWDGLFDGTINWIESDHAPHTLEDKQKGASGIPGIEGMLMVIKALQKAQMPKSRLEELLCTKALNAFGINVPSSPVPAEVTDSMLQNACSAYPFSAWE